MYSDSFVCSVGMSFITSMCVFRYSGLIFVSATFQVDLDPEGVLLNTSVVSSQTVVHNFEITGSNTTNGYTCYLFSDEDGPAGPG